MSAAPDPSARQVLEPCPFCGSAHVDVVMFETHHNEMWHRAECQNCMAKSSGSKYPALAIAAWNRRPPDPAVAELVEALQLVRGIIKDAAMEGFNYQYGDWADRLFRSQADTHAVLAKHAASPRDAT